MLISLKNYWDSDAVERLLAECMWAGAAEIAEEVDQMQRECTAAGRDGS
ncbi:hypothetical protein [Paenibacillus graminis]|nr:hypothetical protein [Paenibacillus graminis]MEC0172989.1 hypothetical protein [Paenibacillus graminis]